MTEKIAALARAGYAARGVVYLVVGLFAALAAFGRSETKGARGALVSLLSQPFGTLLVWLMVVGLVGYSGWRLFQAVRDTDRHGKDARGIAVRFGLFGSAVIHLALAGFALGLVSRWGETGGGDPTVRWLAGAFAAGYAQIIVWVAAAVVLAVGVAQVWKGVTAGFDDYLDAPEAVMRWLRPLSRFGLAARGVVFLVLAALIVSGGYAYEADEQPGLEDALAAIQDFRFGWALLLVAAVGLLAFAVYSLAEAWYRRIELR